MKQSVTKDELREELKLTKNELRQELASTKDELSGLFEKVKDDIFNRLDDISGQLETIRQEQIMAYGKDKEFEERISTLEHSQP